MRLLSPAVAATVALIACADRTPDRITGSIELDRGVLLTGSGDTVDFTFPSSPILASNGAIVVDYVASTHGTLATFNADGSLALLFGRPGSGPGELGLNHGQPWLSGIGIGRSDSLFVGDSPNGRISVFSPPPATAFARSFKPPRLLSGFRVTPEGFLSAGLLVSPGFLPGTTARKPGEPFSMIYVPPRLLSWDTTVLAEFGSRFTTDGTMPTGASTLDSSGSLWVAKPDRYQIDLIGRDGKTVRTLSRTVAWFPIDTSKPAFPWVKPPPTQIHDLSTDTGVIWVLIRRAHRDWAKHRPLKTPELKPGMPISMFPTFRADEIYEGVLEALDVSTGKVLASREVGGDFRAFVGPATLYQQVEDSSGIISLQIWKAVLKRR